jgi:hypothetical protein
MSARGLAGDYCRPGSTDERHGKNLIAREVPRCGYGLICGGLRRFDVTSDGLEQGARSEQLRHQIVLRLIGDKLKAVGQDRAGLLELARGQQCPGTIRHRPRQPSSALVTSEGLDHGGYEGLRLCQPSLEAHMEGECEHGDPSALVVARFESKIDRLAQQRFGAVGVAADVAQNARQPDASLDG